MSREVSAVEEPVPRRALVVPPRADSVEVDAVDPVRELTLEWRSGGVEERISAHAIGSQRQMRPWRPVAKRGV